MLFGCCCFFCIVFLLFKYQSTKCKCLGPEQNRSQSKHEKGHCLVASYSLIFDPNDDEHWANKQTNGNRKRQTSNQTGMERIDLIGQWMGRIDLTSQSLTHSLSLLKIDIYALSSSGKREHVPFWSVQVHKLDTPFTSIHSNPNWKWIDRRHCTGLKLENRDGWRGRTGPFGWMGGGWLFEHIKYAIALCTHNHPIRVQVNTFLHFTFASCLVGCVCESIKIIQQQ